MHRSFIQCCLLACTLPHAPASAAADIREGFWEISMQADLNGQPMSEAPMVIRQCMSQQSAQDLMAKMGGAGACQISDLQQSDSHARWKLTCTGQLEISGSGEADFGADQFSGRMNLEVGLGGQTFPMAQNFKARRVGDCQ